MVIPPDEKWEDEIFDTWGVIYRANPDRCKTCGRLSRYSDVHHICFVCIASKSNSFSPDWAEKYLTINDDFFEPSEVVNEAQDVIEMRRQSVVRATEKYFIPDEFENDPTYEKMVRARMARDGARGAAPTEEDEYFW